MSCHHRSSSLEEEEEEEEEVTALVTQPLQSCPFRPCPQGLTLTTVPCPLQLQLFLLRLLLYKEEEGHEGVHIAKSLKGTPTLFSQGAPSPSPGTFTDGAAQLFGVHLVGTVEGLAQDGVADHCALLGTAEVGLIREGHS